MRLYKLTPRAIPAAALPSPVYQLILIEQHYATYQKFQKNAIPLAAGPLLLLLLQQGLHHGGGAGEAMRWGRRRFASKFAGEVVRGGAWRRQGQCRTGVVRGYGNESAWRQERWYLVARAVLGGGAGCVE